MGAESGDFTAETLEMMRSEALRRAREALKNEILENGRFNPNVINSLMDDSVTPSLRPNATKLEEAQELNLGELGSAYRAALTYNDKINPGLDAVFKEHILLLSHSHAPYDVAHLDTGPTGEFLQRLLEQDPQAMQMLMEKCLENYGLMGEDFRAKIAEAKQKWFGNKDFWALEEPSQE